MVTDVRNEEFHIFFMIGRVVVVVQAHSLDSGICDGASTIRHPVDVEYWYLPREPYMCELMMCDELWMDEYSFSPAVLQG